MDFLIAFGFLIFTVLGIIFANWVLEQFRLPEEPSGEDRSFITQITNGIPISSLKKHENDEKEKILIENSGIVKDVNTSKGDVQNQVELTPSGIVGGHGMAEEMMAAIWRGITAVMVPIIILAWLLCLLASAVGFVVGMFFVIMFLAEIGQMIQ